MKTWTTQEIFNEAFHSFNALWKIRTQLNSLNKSEFTDLITPNSYPDKIRESVRDTLSYLFVNMLNDSTAWSPEQANDYYQLNLNDMIHGIFTQAPDLNSEKIHPIQKMAFILEDLRSWNEQKLNVQGALEAKLALYRILHSRFSGEQDRDKLTNELKKLLDRTPRAPAKSGRRPERLPPW